MVYHQVSLSSTEALVFLGFNITMRYIPLHFTWWILEQERSRWAKERRRQRKKAREGAKPLHDLHRKVGQVYTSKQKVIFKLNNIRHFENKIII
jgi:hypothetical protein